MLSELLQDIAAEHSTMAYRAPELFDVKTGVTLDEKVDIWVRRTLLRVINFDVDTPAFSRLGVHYLHLLTSTLRSRVSKQRSREVRLPWQS